MGSALISGARARVAADLAAALLLAALGACPRASPAEAHPRAYGAVDDARLTHADADPGQWMSYGRTYSEQRFSPLAGIDTGNVARLGLAWYADFDTNRGQESTPVEVDGVLYVTTAWSKVRAFDAASGKLLWSFDPKVAGEWGVNACCDVVNRGVAVWKGKVYLGTLDGRLIALDARSGRPVWQVQTTDPSKAYSITGAPRIARDKVLIGEAGSEFSQRGYLSAYDAATGRLDWRWYIVPGDPAKGFENAQMARAARTWGGEWWKSGGGGGPWDAITYDAATGYVLVGTGNGAPWPAEIRSPRVNDNLYLASIVALRLDSGEYVWHYQETPHESWDYDATQQIILADLTIGGRRRHVAMQASKNGYFYMLDARSGELLSARAFVPGINWSFGIDLKSGRPRFNPQARYDQSGTGFIVSPSGGGAHSWHPMSYDPQTGLVYIPAVYGNYPMVATHEDDNPMGQKLSISMIKGFAMFGQPGAPKRLNAGFLLAWDPVSQRVVWRVPFGDSRGGGTLSTAGGLVFQGNSAHQEFAAYRATDGRKLWSFPVYTGIVAGPATFSIDGVQYVAVAAGSRLRGDYYASNHSRLLVFRLDGGAALPQPVPFPKRELDPPPQFGSPETVRQGAALYDRFCGTCHGTEGQSRGLFPDLRYSAALSSPELFRAVVIDGVLKANGMVSFSRALSPAQAETIRAYMVERSHYAQVHGPGGFDGMAPANDAKTAASSPGSGAAGDSDAALPGPIPPIAQ